MVSLSAAAVVILASGFLFFRYQLLAVLQIPKETAMGALCYFTVVLAGIPLTMAYNLESGLLRAVGDSVTPLLFLIFSSGVNVGLAFLYFAELSGASIFQKGISGSSRSLILERCYG